MAPTAGETHTEHQHRFAIYGMETLDGVGRSLVWMGSPALSFSWTKFHNFLAMRELG